MVIPAPRLVLMRSAMNMSPDRGGVFDVLLGLVRHGLDGRAGHGRQFISWIHDEDFAAAVRWLSGSTKAATAALVARDRAACAALGRARLLR